MDITIYHNPRCGKSRAACQLLDTKGKSAKIVEYLKTPLSEGELQAVLAKLDKKPSDIVRKTEAVYKEKFAGKTLDDAAWIAALLAHPILMQRPIVVVDNAAWIVRDAAAIEELLENL